MTGASRLQTYLFVLPWSLSYVGGVNQVVINLAREMMKGSVFQPLVLITDWEATTPVWEQMHGVNTVRWRVRSLMPGASLKERIAFLLWSKRFQTAFNRFCAEHDVGAINVHYPGPSALTVERLARDFKRPIPLILSFHGADLSTLRKLPALHIDLWRRLLQRIEGVVVCSADLGEKLVEVFGNDLVPEVIHNGLDAAAFVAMAETSDLDGARSILNVARFEHKKGQDVLIEAFALIADRYPDLRLVLVGADDTALPDLEALSVRRGVSERVRLVRNVPHRQIPEFFRRATIFALPSRQEPFGIVLLEAGAFRLPVVASRVGGIPEIVTDRLTGRLVEPNDAKALAEVLCSLLDAPDHAREMGSRFHDEVLSRFSWTTAHDRYMSLLARHRAPIRDGSRRRTLIGANVSA